MCAFVKIKHIKNNDGNHEWVHLGIFTTWNFHSIVGNYLLFMHDEFEAIFLCKIIIRLIYFQFIESIFTMIRD
jgi:hypothetical protein